MLTISMDTMPTLPVSGRDADAAALARWRDGGDRAALAELFARHADRCWRVARRFAGEAEAEDAMQDGFIRAMARAGQWRGGDASAWLIAIVANAARNRARQSRRRQRREAAILVEPAAAASGDPVDPALRRHLAAALDELPKASSDVLRLRLIDGLSHAEVAAALGVREGTARTRLHRAIERLRALLGRRGVTVASPALALLLTPRVIEAAPPGTDAIAARAAWSTTPLTTPMGGAGWIVALGLVALIAAPLAALRLAADVSGVAAGAPAEDPLDQPVTVRLFNDYLDEALAQIRKELPDASPLRFAYGYSLNRGWSRDGVTYEQPWSGVSLDAGAQARPVRVVLDEVARALGFAWRAEGEVVVFSRPADPVAAAILIAAVDAGDLAAVERFGDPGALLDDLAVRREVMPRLLRSRAPATDRIVERLMGRTSRWSMSEAPPRTATLDEVCARDADIVAAAREALGVQLGDSQLALALDVVGLARDQAARPALRRLLAHERVGDEAAAAFARVAAADDLPLLIGLLGELAGEHRRASASADPSVQWLAGAVPVIGGGGVSPGPGLVAVVDALGESGDPRALAVLRPLAIEAGVGAALREAAMSAAAQIDPGSLAAFADDADPSIARAARRALSSDAALAVRWMTGLNLEDDEDRTTLERLAPSLGAAAVLDFARSLPEADEEQRSEMFAAWGLLAALDRARPAPELLRAALGDGHARVRRLAARHLIASRRSEDLDAVIAAADDGSLEAMVAVAGSRDPAAQRATAALIVDGAVAIETRIRLVEAWSYRSSAPLGIVLGLCRDARDPRLRRAAYGALSGNDPRIPAARLAGAVSDPDPRVRGDLVAELAPGDEAAPASAAILAATRHPHRYVRACGVYALTSGRGQRWCSERQAAILRDDADDQVRAYAALLLASGHGPELLAALRDDASPRVRRAAGMQAASEARRAQRCGEAGAAELIAAVAAAAAEDADPVVRTAVEGALMREVGFTWVRPPSWSADGEGDLLTPAGSG